MKGAASTTSHHGKAVILGWFWPVRRITTRRINSAICEPSASQRPAMWNAVNASSESRRASSSIIVRATSGKVGPLMPHTRTAWTADRRHRSARFQQSLRKPVVRSLRARSSHPPARSGHERRCCWPRTDAAPFQPGWRLCESRGAEDSTRSAPQGRPDRNCRPCPAARWWHLAGSMQRRSCCPASAKRASTSAGTPAG